MNALRFAPRLTAEERRQSIIEAVMGLFADKGFDGTTTRELAQAAGVSEALLFKHFPSKQALYISVLEACAKEPGYAELVSNRILKRDASSSTLVHMVHFVMMHFVKGTEERTRTGMERLAVQSLLSDGEFLRLSINKVADMWIQKFEDCIKAATAAGDMRDNPVKIDLRLLFIQHIAFSLMLHIRLPSMPAIDYRVSQEELIEQASWFALLGIGMKEEAIQRIYDPKSIM